jgi:hypothetical protein
MRTNKLLLFLLVAVSSTSFAQQKETSDKNLSVFRFYPFQLITSSLAFGKETFNADRSKSTVLMLGVRYKNWEGTGYNPQGTGIDQFNNWQGISAGVERRFYVPSFRTPDKGTFFDNNGSFGVYLAPGLRGDFNQRNYDYSTYMQIYDNEKQITTNSLVTNKQKSNLIGIMPYMNLGLQFTIFQYMYIDMYAGGGLRFLQENITSQTKSGSGANDYYYNSGNGALEEIVLKKGVQPNIGLTIGLKL